MKFLSNFVLAVTIAVALFASLFCITAPFGIRPYVILSGSMEPEIPTGSVAYIDVKDRTDLEVGDVIMYRASEEINVTHRIIDFDSAGNLITKGDANDTADLRPVSPNSVVGTYVFSIPYIGKIAAYFTTARKLVVGIALIVFNIIAQGAEHLFGDDEDDEEDDKSEPEPSTEASQNPEAAETINP